MRKKRIELLTANQVVQINKEVTSLEKQRHFCLDVGKVESALAAAYYPGSYPFQYGGVAQVGGALCYFITKAHAFFDGNKRTAGIAATTFLALNNYLLRYPFNIKTGKDDFADIINDTAANTIGKEQIIDWFEGHKVKMT